MPNLFRNRNYKYEPIWHLQIVMLLAIGLQLLLSNHYVLLSRWLLIAIEILLMGSLAVTTPKKPSFHSLKRRLIVFLLIACSGLANIYSLVKVSQLLLTSHIQNGRQLILAAVNIYLTNIIIFALFYWELDGGGPGRRLEAANHEYDFLFPQQQNPDYKHPNWRATFLDYVYFSSTNAMAFSPTDTLPLSRRGKLLMLLQASVSLLVIALVAARAVNILA